jgi:hypothetical protein
MASPLSFLDVVLIVLLAVNCSNVSIERKDIEEIKSACRVK